MMSSPRNGLGSDGMLGKLWGCDWRRRRFGLLTTEVLVLLSPNSGDLSDSLERNARELHVIVLVA